MNKGYFVLLFLSSTRRPPFVVKNIDPNPGYKIELIIGENPCDIKRSKR